MEWYDYLLNILVGIAILVPIVAKLIQYVRIAIMERNWPDLIKMVTDLMVKAERKFATGAERKEWVLTNVKAQSDKINYDINYDAVSDMIDSFCKFTKGVNPPKAETAPSAEEKTVTTGSADIKQTKAK